MSLKKEVDLRNRKFIVYSSEMKERMKIYFNLTTKYNKCLITCPKNDDYSKKNCEKLCEKVYDKYSELLLNRYKNCPEKLLEKVERSPIYKERKKDFTKSLWYKLFLVKSPFYKENGNEVKKESDV